MNLVTRFNPYTTDALVNVALNLRVSQAMELVSSFLCFAYELYGLDKALLCMIHKHNTNNTCYFSLKGRDP